jgi:hypothetical protein
LDFNKTFNVSIRSSTYANGYGLIKTGYAPAESHVSLTGVSGSLSTSSTLPLAIITAGTVSGIVRLSNLVVPVSTMTTARAITVTGSSDCVIESCFATTGKGFLTYTTSVENALLVLRNITLTNQEATAETIRISTPSTASIEFYDVTVNGTQVTGNAQIYITGYKSILVQNLVGSYGTRFMHVTGPASTDASMTINGAILTNSKVFFFDLVGGTLGGSISVSNVTMIGSVTSSVVRGFNFGNAYNVTMTDVSISQAGTGLITMSNGAVNGSISMERIDIVGLTPSAYNVASGLHFISITGVATANISVSIKDATLSMIGSATQSCTTQHFNVYLSLVHNVYMENITMSYGYGAVSITAANAGSSVILKSIRSSDVNRL